MTDKKDIEKSAPINNAPDQEKPEENIELEAPKKRRGRPPGAKNKPDSGAETVTDVGGADKPKRGRPKKRHEPDIDIKGLAHQIVGLHQLGAMLTNVPEIVISDDESQMLAGAIVNVAKEYDLAIDGKTGAAIQLAATCAAIYMPRFIAVNMKNKRARLELVKKREQNTDANTH